MRPRSESPWPNAPLLTASRRGWGSPSTPPPHREGPRRSSDSVSMQSTLCRSCWGAGGQGGAGAGSLPLSLVAGRKALPPPGWGREAYGVSASGLVNIYDVLFRFGFFFFFNFVEGTVDPQQNGPPPSPRNGTPTPPPTPSPPRSLQGLQHPGQSPTCLVQEPPSLRRALQGVPRPPGRKEDLPAPSRLPSNLASPGREGLQSPSLL